MKNKFEKGILMQEDVGLDSNLVVIDSKKFDYFMNIMIESMTRGLFRFTLATRFNFKSLEDIKKNTSKIIKISNFEMNIKDLFLLYVFSELHQNTNLKLTPEWIIDVEDSTGKYVKNLLNSFLSDIFQKHELTWFNPNIFSILSTYLSAKNRENNEIPTPLSLIVEQNQNCDIKINSNIEDPCCGSGSYLYDAKQKLVKLGLTEDQSLDRLYGIEINPEYAFIASALLDPKGKYKSRIYLYDTLEKDAKDIDGKKDYND